MNNWKKIETKTKKHNFIHFFAILHKKTQNYASLRNYYAVNRIRCYIFSNIQQKENNYSKIKYFLLKI